MCLILAFSFQFQISNMSAMMPSQTLLPRMQVSFEFPNILYLKFVFLSAMVSRNAL